jgi:hypothetical protein
MTKLRTIPQKHGGTIYRSRTEARWAEFFRITFTPFEYEPEGYQLGSAWYVPDFLLTEAEAFFEVKGGSPTLPERHKAWTLARQSEKPVLIACGNPSATVSVLYFAPDGSSGQCSIVEEHNDDGAWAAEFVCGGGWSFPFSAGLVNCGTHGHQHRKLEEAGKLQFNAPDLEAAAPPVKKAIGDWIQIGTPVWPILKGAWMHMKKRNP